MRVGQHYNQAGYIGRYYGRNNINKKVGREAKISVIDINELIKLKNCKLDLVTLKEQVKNLIIPKSAQKIFSGTFLFKKIENENFISKLEEDFLLEAYTKGFEKLFNKNLNNTFHITMNYYALHEARNFENFHFLKKQLTELVYSNNSIDDFIKNTYFIHYCNTDQKELIKKLILEMKKLIVINNSQLFEKKIREIFNYVYIIAWKKIELNYSKRNWFILDIEQSVGMSNNLVLDLQKPCHKNYKHIPHYKNLPEKVKNILDSSIIIFLSNNCIAIGNSISINDFPVMPFVENYRILYSFLVTIAIAHSYEYIIIADDLQKEVILNAFCSDTNGFIQQLEDTKKLMK